MATLTGTRGTTTFPVGGFGEASNLKVAWGSYNFATNPPAGDIGRLCWVPKNAIVLGGYVQGSDLDTNATEELDFDLGWLANGTEAADPDGLGNFGVITTDTVAGIKPESGFYLPLSGVLNTTGPQKFSADTVIAITVNVDAATFAAGILTAVVFYVIDY